jgi:putative hydrolase of the HAD superfamily
MRITTVGLDADDTLWHNETIFRLTQDRLRDLMADVATAECSTPAGRGREAQPAALRLWVKGFTLSMIETAMELTGNDRPAG